MLTATFALYLLVVLSIGCFAFRRMETLYDYLLGGRRMGVWVTAISAQASDMSGWLLVGLPAFAYGSGFSCVWIAIGLSLGTFFNWALIARRLRVATERYGAITVPDYLEARFNDRSHTLRVLSTLFVLLFYTAYIGAQFIAAGKLLVATFDVPYVQGVIFGAVVILVYTVAGGFVAVCWTDLFQGLLMVFATVLLPVVALSKAGGWSAAVAKWSAIDGGQFLTVTGGKTGAAFMVGVVISQMAWGLGYPGQIHILTRFMAVEEPAKIRRAFLISMIWVVLALYGALAIGHVARVVLPPEAVTDTDHVMALLAKAVLPPWVAGVIIAAAVAAMMSTVDSQILVAVSAVVRDLGTLFREVSTDEQHSLRISRGVTVVIGVCGVVLALSKGKVFDKVMFAWGALGASFGPVLILSLWWKGTTRLGAITGMIAGGGCALIWRNVSQLADAVNGLAPAFALGLAATWVVSLCTSQTPASADPQQEPGEDVYG